uniref:N-acetylglucosaminylphosphatidylinositol deacetylase n=1 Tax=Clastoptera arizonana TaxID=38151 RepID=A0A1B6D1I9_9HEMI
MLDLFGLNFLKVKQVVFENSFFFWKEFNKYIRDSVFNITFVLTTYLVLCFLFYVILEFKYSSSKGKYFDSVKRVLLVIAHPDDECMFFGPAIIKLQQCKDCDLHLLCISVGDYYKLGSVRKHELWNSCKILGIPEENITLCNDTNLPDDPSVRWRDDIVAEIILNQIETYKIDTVVTFDKGGVSKHPNHKSLFCAMAFLCLERKLPSYCKVYLLESVNLFRKYSFGLDGLLSFLLSSFVYPVNFKEHSIIKSAMRAHKSQLFWYRLIYINLSRYMYINTFKEMEVSEVMYDLEIDY